MSEEQLHCTSNKRHLHLFNNEAWNGIDYIEVETNQTELCVHFFGPVPKGLTPANVKIDGGRRITGIKVLSVDVEPSHDDELDDCLHIVLDRPGDFSPYTFCLVNLNSELRPRIDPRYACVDFSFKNDCPSDLDCEVNTNCDDVERNIASGDISYLAKDYASFKQLIYDRLALTLPDWRERHAPDLGVTLVEIMAYAADHLSYYQDAVATEAYLETARFRTSIRRHLRLIDYHLHEGLNARALVTVNVSAEVPLGSSDFYFVTTLGDRSLEASGIVKPEALARLPSGSFEVFEPIFGNNGSTITFRPECNTFAFYTWGDQECCLEKGATRATLVDPRAPPVEGHRAESLLLEGDILIFEEVIGPKTGLPADARRDHRHAVRLTKVETLIDALFNVPLLEIEWSVEDALPFDLCLSAVTPSPECRRIVDVSIATGNVVVVTHGGSQQDPLGPVTGHDDVGDCACEGSIVEIISTPNQFRPHLAKAPLVYSDAIPASGSVVALFTRDIESSTAQMSLLEVPSGDKWTPSIDLMESTATDHEFVVECDENGLATLRFGDGTSGARPATGAAFTAQYRIGIPENGNVAAETITHLVLRSDSFSGVNFAPRNPMPAAGSRRAQSVEEAKTVAPGLLKTRRKRAITASDYAEIAERNKKLQGAAAELRWTGSWREADVSIDPLHTEVPPRVLLDEVFKDLMRYRRMGHDLAVTPAHYIPLQLELMVCVKAHHPQSAVLAKIKKSFKSGGGGFFDPDKLVFGGGIRVSAIIGIAMSIEGVETVKITKLNRQGSKDQAALDTGILPLSAFEIGRLDNDPNFPEHGILKIKLAGGT